MPFKDPAKRRAYQREYQRTYAKANPRARDWSSVNRARRKSCLGRFDACIDAGRCIYHCLTPRPCRNQAVARLYCAKHMPPC